VGLGEAEVGPEGREGAPPHLRQAPVGVGTAVVEEHRDGQLGVHPGRERVRRVDRGQERIVEGHEGHHVEDAEAGVDAGVDPEIEAGRGGAGERDDGREGVPAPGPGEGEHRPVVVGVDVAVEERGPARRGEGVEHVDVAALRHVRHALQHGPSMSALRA